MSRAVLLGVGGQEERACLPPGGQCQRWRQEGPLGGCLVLLGKKQWWLGHRYGGEVGQEWMDSGLCLEVLLAVGCEV